MRTFSFRFLLVALAPLLLGSQVQAQNGPCAGPTAAPLADRVFQQFFTSTDTLIARARTQRGIQQQALTSPHGVVQAPAVCARLRAALRTHLSATGQLNAHLSNGTLPLSFFEFGDYYGVYVYWPSPPGVVLRDASAPVFIFRRSDYSYAASWDVL